MRPIKYVLVVLSILMLVFSAFAQSPALIALAFLAVGWSLYDAYSDIQQANAEHGMNALAIMFHAYRSEYEENGGEKRMDPLLTKLSERIAQHGGVINDNKAMLHTSKALSDAFTRAREINNKKQGETLC